MMKKILLIFTLMFPIISFGQNIFWEQIRPISAQVETTTPQPDDLLLIEVSGVKQYVKISNLPSSGGGASFLDTITLASHGFAVGDVIDYNSKAIGNNPDRANVVGIVYEVIDVNTFTYQYGGVYDKGTWVFGMDYFLSTTVEGETADTTQTYVDGDVYLFMGTGVDGGLQLEIDVGFLIEEATSGADTIIGGYGINVDYVGAAAVVEVDTFEIAGSQDLQAVTDNGNTTTNAIEVGGITTTTATVLQAFPEFFLRTTSDANYGGLSFINASGATRAYILYDYSTDTLKMRIAGNNDRLTLDGSGNMALSGALSSTEVGTKQVNISRTIKSFSAPLYINNVIDDSRGYLIRGVVNNAVAGDYDILDIEKENGTDIFTVSNLGNAAFSGTVTAPDLYTNRIIITHASAQSASGTINVDTRDNASSDLITLTGNSTLNINYAQVGQIGSVLIRQDATGSRTLGIAVYSDAATTGYTELFAGGLELINSKASEFCKISYQIFTGYATISVIWYQ